MIAWLKAVVIAVSAIVGVGSVVILKMKPDNPIEEISEAIIKDETGIDIDLSPGSPEISKDKIALDRKDEEEKKS